MSMRFVVTDDYDALSRAAADELMAIVASQPSASVLVATGNTPMGMYAELADRRVRDQFDASGLRAWQLDEYLGLPADDRRLLYGWMRRSFVEPLGIPDSNVMRLAGGSDDPDAICTAFDRAITAAGGIDVAILGLGPNGHLGFNEPPAQADSPTRVIDLTPESVASNGPYWGGADQVPRRALTVGMRVLLAARLTLLVVSGASKQDILARTVAGPVTPDVPASLLRTAPNVVVIADRAAWGHLPAASTPAPVSDR